jgi:alkylation response protein AidB-like acyl-CoA dehydrogenase
MTQTALAQRPPSSEIPDDRDMCERVRAVAKSKLVPEIDAIDKGELYPADILRAFGAEGAFAPHLPKDGSADIRPAIHAMSVISEYCGATGFMAWCQDTLGWYVANSANAALKAKFLSPVADAQMLGGTGLSNPMKTFFGIEKMKLKGRKVEGGYVVKGALPWVSNLGPDHVFGTIFDREDAQDAQGNPERVMFLVDCADPNVTLQTCPPFMAMDGTGTYAVQVRDAFIPDHHVLADSAMPFVKRIRAGFVLLQAGMGIGIIRDCIEIMKSLNGPLGHVNCFLDQQPEDFEELLAGLEGEVMTLAADPYDPSPVYWDRVIKARLRLGEASVATAHAAMLHCGARGYLKSHRAQRRLREAYFVAIVTPATKQLKKMLADSAQQG